MSIKFGTDGWRSLMSQDFTEQNVEKVAKAVASFLINNGLSGKSLIIGYDTRKKSDVFARICAATVTGYGIKVFKTSRPMPTPLVAFSVLDKQAGGAIMMTASHNPSQYNGIKFISKEGGPSPVSITKKIEQYIDDPLSDQGLNKAQEIEFDPVSRYRSYLKKIIDYENIKGIGIKIAVDPLYGAGYGILDEILKEDLGARTFAIHNFADENFGGKSPEPSRENLQELKQVVIEKKADLGVALDGDGDRFGVMDKDGSLLTSNQILALATQHLIDKGVKGKVVRTFATTHMLDKIAQINGCPLIETPVGFKYIAEQMISDPGDFLIGGEESGGLSVHGHIPEKDGLLADLLMVEMVALHKKSPKSLLDELFERYGYFATKRIDVFLNDDQKKDLIEKAGKNKSFGGLKVLEKRELDGVKFYLENENWLLFRASGTEPVVRVYVETGSDDIMDDIIIDVENLIEQVKNL